MKVVEVMYINGNNSLVMDNVETVRVYSKKDIDRIERRAIKKYKRKIIQNIKFTVSLFFATFGTVFGMIGLYVVFGY